MNDYQKEKENQLNKLLSDLNSLQDKYTFECVEKNGEKYISLSGLIPIYVNYNDYQKRYSFHLWENLPYINGYNDKSKYREDNPEPKNVGVLSKPKIIAWVEYLIREYEFLIELSKDRTVKVEKFISDFKKLDGDKNINTDFNSGRIIKNGIELSFEISNNGYISQRLELYTYPSNDDPLTLFKKLSDNKFTNSK